MTDPNGSGPSGPGTPPEKASPTMPIEAARPAGARPAPTIVDEPMPPSNVPGRTEFGEPPIFDLPPTPPAPYVSPGPAQFAPVRFPAPPPRARRRNTQEMLWIALLLAGSLVVVLAIAVVALVYRSFSDQAEPLPIASSPPPSTPIAPAVSPNVRETTPLTPPSPPKPVAPNPPKAKPKAKVPPVVPAEPKATAGPPAAPVEPEIPGQPTMGEPTTPAEPEPGAEPWRRRRTRAPNLP